MPIDLLDDELQSEIKLIPASKKKRFGTYVIDMICFYIILIFATMVLLSDNEQLIAVVESVNTDDQLIFQFIILILLLAYYIFWESMCKGKTPGKWIMQTRVLEYDGSIPSLDTISKRSFIRIVPFDALSFFGSGPDGWHDRWSKTIVIDENQSIY